jgi:hypothetical protein
MKVILIAWFIVNGNAAGTSVTAEFDSMEACESAAQAIQLAGSKGAGKNITWRYVCATK